MKRSCWLYNCTSIKCPGYQLLSTELILVYSKFVHQPLFFSTTRLHWAYSDENAAEPQAYSRAVSKIQSTSRGHKLTQLWLACRAAPGAGWTRPESDSDSTWRYEGVFPFAPGAAASPPEDSTPKVGWGEWPSDLPHLLFLEAGALHDACSSILQLSRCLLLNLISTVKHTGDTSIWNPYNSQYSTGILSC